MGASGLYSQIEGNPQKLESENNVTNQCSNQVLKPEKIFDVKLHNFGNSQAEYVVDNESEDIQFLQESLINEKDNQILNYSSFDDEDDDCDGVTLCPVTSEISVLTNPSCLESVDSSYEQSSTVSGYSDADTGERNTSFRYLVMCLAVKLL